MKYQFKGLKYLIAVLILGFSCKGPENNNQLIFQNKRDVASPFDLKFDILNLEDGVFNILINVELDKGSYFISAHSKDSFYLPLSFHVEPSNFIDLVGHIQESPEAIETYDELIGKHVRFVRQNTIYTQKAIISRDTDFLLEGYVDLLLEPICIPYRASFELLNKEGTLGIRKEQIKPAPYYTGN